MKIIRLKASFTPQFELKTDVGRCKHVKLEDSKCCCSCMKYKKLSVVNTPECIVHMDIKRHIKAFKNPEYVQICAIFSLLRINLMMLVWTDMNQVDGAVGAWLGATDSEPSENKRWIQSHFLFPLQEKTDKIPITVSMHICDGSSYKYTHAHTKKHPPAVTHTHSGEEHAWMNQKSVICRYIIGSISSRWCKQSFGKGWKRLGGGLTNKTNIFMQKKHDEIFFFSTLLCLFFSDNVDKFLGAGVLLLLYEAHARRTPGGRLTTLIYLFYL